jgi:hypothetical protein
MQHIGQLWCVNPLQSFFFNTQSHQPQLRLRLLLLVSPAFVLMLELVLVLVLAVVVVVVYTTHHMWCTGTSSCCPQQVSSSATPAKHTAGGPPTWPAAVYTTIGPGRLAPCGSTCSPYDAQGVAARALGIAGYAQEERDGSVCSTGTCYGVIAPASSSYTRSSSWEKRTLHQKGGCIENERARNRYAWPSQSEKRRQQLRQASAAWLLHGVWRVLPYTGVTFKMLHAASTWASTTTAVVSHLQDSPNAYTERACSHRADCADHAYRRHV